MLAEGVARLPPAALEVGGERYLLPQRPTVAHGRGLAGLGAGYLGGGPEDLIGTVPGKKQNSVGIGVDEVVRLHSMLAEARYRFGSSGLDAERAVGPGPEAEHREVNLEELHRVAVATPHHHPSTAGAFHLKGRQVPDAGPIGPPPVVYEQDFPGPEFVEGLQEDVDAPQGGGPAWPARRSASANRSAAVRPGP